MCVVLMDYLKENYPDSYEVVNLVPFKVEKIGFSSDRKDGKGGGGYGSKGSFCSFTLDVTGIPNEYHTLLEMISWYKTEKSILLGKLISSEVSAEEYSNSLNNLVRRCGSLINSHVTRFLLTKGE